MNGVTRVLLVALLLAWATAGSGEVTVDDLRKEVNDLRKQIAGRQEQRSTPIAGADALVASKYGPGSAVTTKTGKLYIGGALQLWFVHFQNDNHDWTNATKLGSDGGSNSSFDNDTFEMRRLVLRFGMDITENVSSFVLVDNATEPNSWAAYPQNQGQIYTNSINTGKRSNTPLYTGSGITPIFLLDAKINYHGVIPHHDFTIGQFKRKLGEEGSRPSDTLDFVDRSFVGQISHNSYDIGIEGHGTWWDERFQYWFGTQNGPGNIFSLRVNRADDNNDKNVFGSVMVRPIWKDEIWGGLELGDSVEGGKGGKGANEDPNGDPLNNLNRQRTKQFVDYAWARYLPAGPVKGWWMQGEWAQFRDRLNSGVIVTGDANVTTDPAPFKIEGWYVATGYNLRNSRFADSVPNWVKPFEFTYRHEVFQNLFYFDPNVPERRFNVYATTVNTAGVNYNIKGHNAKVMVNYNWVDEDDNHNNGDRQTRDVRNDNLAVQFQVAW